MKAGELKMLNGDDVLAVCKHKARSFAECNDCQREAVKLIALAE